jgi:hypothetical protein
LNRQRARFYYKLSNLQRTYYLFFATSLLF